MNRDINGKFVKNNYFQIPIPSLNYLISFIFYVILLFPWVYIIVKNDFFSKIISLFDRIVSSKIDTDTSHINGDKTYWK